MQQKTRFLYLPWVISLIGIWVFYFAFKEKFSIKNETCISLAIPKDGNDDKLYSLGAITRQIAHKKQIKIELNADKQTNQKKIELIRYEARKLNYTQDTTTVINIRLTNEVTYNELIQLIDQCYSDKIKRFTLLKNSFIIFGEYPKHQRTDTIK
jgi:hypothetical protein